MKIIALNVECNIFFLFFFWWLGYHTVSNPTLETMHMFLICLSRFKPQCVQKALPVMTIKTEYLKASYHCSTFSQSSKNMVIFTTRNSIMK